MESEVFASPTTEKLQQRRLEDQEIQEKAREFLDISQAVEATHPHSSEMTDEQIDELREYAEHRDLPQRQPFYADPRTNYNDLFSKVEKIEKAVERMEKRQLPLTESEKVELRKAMGNLKMSWPKSGDTVHRFLIRAYGSY